MHTLTQDVLVIPSIVYALRQGKGAYPLPDRGSCVLKDTLFVDAMQLYRIASGCHNGAD
jgi:hypothetical protein